MAGHQQQTKREKGHGLRVLQHNYGAAKQAVETVLEMAVQMEVDIFLIQE